MNALSLFDDLVRFWQRLGEGWRIFLGSLLILVLAFTSLMPNSIFGIEIVWSFATLWAAIGWGLAGISLRPLFLLSLFGLLQDVQMDAPIGCFMVINLSVYGLSVWAGENFDFDADPVRRMMVAPIGIGIGIFALWVFSSTSQDYRVSVSSFIGPYCTTLIGYMVFSWVFKLRGDPVRGF